MKSEAQGDLQHRCTSCPVSPRSGGKLLGMEGSGWVCGDADRSATTSPLSQPQGAAPPRLSTNNGIILMIFTDPNTIS